MANQLFRNTFLFISVFLFTHFNYGQTNLKEKQIMVSMRMIGHEILIASEDSLSRVLPIEKVNNRYKIQFESEFEFVPNDLIVIINQVVEDTKIARHYIVEVEKCETRETVYSYEIVDIDSLAIIPCKLRAQPKDCYNIFFTILDSTKIEYAETSNETDYFITILVMVILLTIVLLIFYMRKPKTSSINRDSDIITIGGYKFDKIQMELFYERDKVELTSKESDLLILLYSSANIVIERDVILQSVWGDEGDYVGRTLDVFISKLRKKLSKDESVKIVNVRGVGYKLVMGS